MLSFSHEQIEHVFSNYFFEKKCNHKLNIYGASFPHVRIHYVFLKHSFWIGVIIKKKSRSAVSSVDDEDDGYVINPEHLHNYPPTYSQVMLRLLQNLNFKSVAVSLGYIVSGP